MAWRPSPEQGRAAICGGAAAPLFSLGVGSQGLSTGDNQGSIFKIGARGVSATPCRCAGVGGRAARDLSMRARPDAGSGDRERARGERAAAGESRRGEAGAGARRRSRRAAGLFFI